MAPGHKGALSAAVGKRSPASAGFILVETIVTMAISAFLLVALTMLISFVAQSFDRAAAIGNDLEIESRFLSAVSRDLRLARRVTWAGREQRFVFRGTASRVLYVEQASGPDDAGDLRMIDLDTGGAEGSGVMTRRVGMLMPHAGDFADVAMGAPETPYTGNFRIRFAYFGDAGQGLETLSDEWPNEEKMPVAIQVSLVGSNGRVSGGGLRIPLMIDAEPGCALPDEANCAYVKEEMVASRSNTSDDAPGDDAPVADPIDPNDPLGWERYAQ